MHFIACNVFFTINAFNFSSKKDLKKHCNKKRQTATQSDQYFIFLLLNKGKIHRGKAVFLIKNIIYSHYICTNSLFTIY